MEAAQSGCIEAITFMLDLGAHTHIEDHHGRTSIGWAAMERDGTEALIRIVKGHKHQFRDQLLHQHWDAILSFKEELRKELYSHAMGKILGATYPSTMHREIVSDADHLSEVEAALQVGIRQLRKNRVTDLRGAMQNSRATKNLTSDGVLLIITAYLCPSFALVP